MHDFLIFYRRGAHPTELEFANEIGERFSGFSRDMKFAFQFPVENTIRFLDIKLEFRKRHVSWDEDESSHSKTKKAVRVQTA